MLLGTILHRLGRAADSAEAIEAIGDIALLAQVRDMGALYDESPADYACGAARRFARDASGEDWLALMTSIERNGDAARTALEHMLRWSLKQDAAGSAVPSGCGCGRGGSGDAPG
jgi:hypothetical protein